MDLGTDGFTLLASSLTLGQKEEEVENRLEGLLQGKPFITCQPLTLFHTVAGSV